MGDLFSCILLLVFFSIHNVFVKTHRGIHSKRAVPVQSSSRTRGSGSKQQKRPSSNQRVISNSHESRVRLRQSVPVERLQLTGEDEEGKLLFGDQGIVLEDGPTDTWLEDGPTDAWLEDGPTDAWLEDGPTDTWLEDGPTDAWLEDGPTDAWLEDGPTDTWYTRQVRRAGTVSVPARQRDVNVYKSSNANGGIMKDDVSYPPTLRGDNCYWYHTTDYSSANDIVLHGIKLGYGKPKQDFSNGDGFYVGPTFKHAKNMVTNGKILNPAIIVFKFNFKSGDFREMNLVSSKSEWVTVVKYNRSGRQYFDVDKDREVLMRFHESDYVLGPVNGGSAGARCMDHSWTPTGFWKPYTQLCIRSQSMAELFGDINNVESVLFY